MHSEVRLDALLSDDATFDGQPAHLTQQDPAIAPMLLAAAQLRPLRAQQPTVAFARSLETRLIEHTAALRSANAPANTPASVTLAGGVPHDAPTLAGRGYVVDGDAPTLPGIVSMADHRASAPHWPGAQPAMPRRQTRHGGRSRIWWPAVAAALVLVIGAGTLTAAASAGPGSPLFALHQLERGVQANISSPADRVRADLQASDAALTALDAATAEHGASGDGVYTDALRQLLSDEHDAARDLADVPHGADFDALSAHVRAANARARASLHTALHAPDALSWSNRLAATRGLSALGESVPVATSARVDPVSGSDESDDSKAHSGDTQWRVTLTGTGFEFGAVLVINGQQVTAEIGSLTANEIVAVVHPDAALQSSGRGVGSSAIASVGVLNSDGTAAATTQVASAVHVQSTPGSSDGSTSTGGHDSGGQGSSHGGSQNATPTPTPTRGK